MAQAEINETLEVSKEKLFKVVTDYAKYPEFVDGMKKVTSSKNADGTVKAAYEVSTMGKEINYTLTLKESFDAGTVEWTLLESSFFKHNNGGWKIEATGPNQCKVRYWLDVEFTFPIPGFILKGLVKNSIPGMVESFLKRAQSV